MKRIVIVIGLLVLSVAGLGTLILKAGGDEEAERAPRLEAEDRSALPAGTPGVEALLDASAYRGESAASEGEADSTGQAAAPAPQGQAAPQAQPPAPELQGLLDRKIVQSASLDVEVNEVGRAFQEIVRFATTVPGGFVASSTFSNVDDQQVADITVRVPADRYQDVLAQIRGLGQVQTESSNASDVTEEYTDLQARLRTLEATERRYLELLGEAADINQILMVQDRLDGVRAQIEQVQGRINLLDHLTDLATITVHVRPTGAPAFEPPADGGPQPLEAAAAAWERSLEAVRGLAAGFLVVSVFSWWLLPFFVALAFAARWWLRRSERPAPREASM